MDGRIVFLVLVVVLAVIAARDLDAERPPAVVARERALDAVLVEVDRAQLCRRTRRRDYAATVPSLQFSGGSFMRTALRHGLDISLATTGDGSGYVQRVSGPGVEGLVERRGAAVVRLDVGDRPPPRLAASCDR